VGTGLGINCSFTVFHVLFSKTGVSNPDREAVEDCILAGMKASRIADDDDVAEAAPATITKNAGGILDPDSDSDQQDEYSSQDDRLQAELNNYKFMKTEPLSTDPLHFWRMKETVFPHVAVQAKKLLSMPATSVPCERLFSTGGILINKRRSALHPNHVRQMLCLQSWLE